MQSPDRLNNIMGNAIHLLDDLLKSRPRIPDQVVDLVHWTLAGTAQIIDYAVDRGLAAASRPSEKTS
jgi:hypothetical protein